jgi:glycosyltransferase involved in cell wall biosynthesis
LSSKVSVIVTCYNHAPYIEQCIRSIFAQTHKNIDLFIINDGSTDESDRIIKRVIKESPFDVTEYVFQENKGACYSRNLGLDWAANESNSDFILLVDSDNYLDRTHIETSINVLVCTNYDIAYTSLKDADTGLIVNEVPDFSLGRLINCNYIDTCSLIRKTALKANRFDLYLNRLFMQDYDFFLALIHSGAKAIKVNGLYQNYRMLAGSLGNKAADRKERLKWFEVYRYIISKYPEWENTTVMFSTWYYSSNDEITALQSEKDKLQSEKDKLQSEKDGLQSEKDGLQSEKDGLQSEKDGLQSEKDGLQSEKDSLAADLTETKSQLQQVLNSRTFKTGQILLKPFKAIKQFFKLSL